jgi:poly(beta-D-mannuronate) lyase
MERKIIFAIPLFSLSFFGFVVGIFKFSNLQIFKSLLLIASMALPALVMSKTVTVSSLADLQLAISDAKPGDIIFLKNGVYTTTGDIFIDRAGTELKPITISAQTQGAAEINGVGGFNLVSPAAYVIISGFKFTHAASKARLGPGTSFCRWTRNIFETPGTGDYLTIAGSDHQVDYNTFQNKDSLGKFIAVKGTGSQIAERLWIHHNYFKTHKNQGNRNGAEALQFGLSGFSLSSSNSIIEHNLFEDCAGENELISVKASKVTVRYNTIRNCPAQFTLRHGNYNQVYGNYFINTPGLRIFGDDHVIHSNHFENCSIGINIGNGGAEVADGAPLTSHDRPDRVLIAFNTLVNNKTNIVQTARTNGLGSTNITIANNIVQGGGPAASIVGPSKNPVWEGNIIFNTEGAGDMPEGTYKTIDPKLTRDGMGEYHLGSGSPAVNSSVGNYSSVTTDMDGQPRTATLDVGADEWSTIAIKARILKAADVGHLAPSRR